MDFLKSAFIKTRLLIVLVMVSLCSCAQTKYGIVKAHAYLQETTPGIVMADDLHRGPDTLYRIYVETKAGSAIQWITASVGNKVYKVISSKAAPPVTIGVLKATGDSAIVSIKTGNILWQLNLEKQGVSNSLAHKNNSIKKAVLLKLKSKNKVRYYKVSPVVDLQTEHYM